MQPAATTSPSPAPTTGCGTRWRSWPSPTRRCSPTTTPTTSSRWSSAAWLGPNYQVTSAAQRGQPGRHGADRAPRLPPRLHAARDRGAVPGARARALAGADAAGRGRALRHAGRDRADACTCRTRRSTCPATWPIDLPRVPGVLRRPTTCSCRWRRATRCSSTRRCSTAPAPTAPPTSSGWRTCCRCRPRSAGRWRRSTGPRCREALYPTLLARKRPGASEHDLRNVIAAAAEGYPFPTNLDRDQPIGSLNPESQAELVWRALENDWDQETFAAELAAQTERRRSARWPGDGVVDLIKAAAAVGQPLRVGVIGAGIMGADHANTLHRLVPGRRGRRGRRRRPRRRAQAPPRAGRPRVRRRLRADRRPGRRRRRHRLARLHARRAGRRRGAGRQAGAVREAARAHRWPSASA